MRILLAVATLVLLAACGGSPTATPQAGNGADFPAFPKCSEIWVAGKSLPDGYAGCEGRVTNYPATEIECSTGSMVYAEFDGAYHWVMLPGGVIKVAADVDKSPEYAADYAACNK